MAVLSIVGARPQFVKLAPISRSSVGVFEHKILHTGQHYDNLLSESFFHILEIPTPNFQLNIGSGTHANQTGRMLMEIENILLQEKPEHVILYGDTNTTLAGALAAKKLNISVSHVEAGLRSFNRKMPEEINRVVTDHCSDLLFAPTATAMQNLQNEGLAYLSILSGDVMVETLDFIKKRVKNEGEDSNFLFATIHRPENTDFPQRLIEIILHLRKSPIKVHLHCHPRLMKALETLNLAEDADNLFLLPPLDYISTINAVLESKGVITDSGGLQKEAYILGKPCLILRTETEWLETLVSGSSHLDPHLERINKHWWTLNKPNDEGKDIFGDGSASKIIVSAISNYGKTNSI